MLAGDFQQGVLDLGAELEVELVRIDHGVEPAEAHAARPSRS